MNTLKKLIIGIMLLSGVITIILIRAYSQNLLNGITHTQILLEKSEFDNAIRDDFSFKNVFIENNLLNLEISYSGGCVSHDFSLIGSGVFAESYPVETSIVLSHEDNNDNCDSIITDTLIFDLTPLKELYTESYSESSGAITIFLLGYTQLSHIYGWVNLISYEF